MLLWNHYYADTKERHWQGEKRMKIHRPMFLINSGVESLNKILAHQIQQHFQMIVYHDQVEFSPYKCGRVYRINITKG